MTKTTTEYTMDQLVLDHPDDLVPFKVGDVVEGVIISITSHSVIVDINGLTLGLVPEREFSYDVSDLSIGDKIMGYVLMSENMDGYVIISMKRADRERVWLTLQEKHDSGELLKVRITAANRGGLMAEFGGVEGFIPVSQLSSEHYPKVEGGDQSKIVSRLKQLVKSNLEVKVITVDRTNNKIIFSEKAVGEDKLIELSSSMKVGDVVSGKVAGVVDYGIFVTIDVPNSEKTLEGLIHISEVAWERIDDLTQRYKIGDNLKSVVIGIQNGRVSLSIKQLTPDPWEQAASKLKSGSKVNGQVTRVTPFGAFVRLENGIDGLVHISELGDSITNPTSVVTEGKSYSFNLMAIDPKTHKISLSLKETNSTTDSKKSKGVKPPKSNSTNVELKSKISKESKPSTKKVSKPKAKK